MPVRFYNPGSRVYEKMAFDHPTNDIKSVNLIAYFQIDAPEKSFFEVPTEVEVETLTGPTSVSVKFADRIQRDYKEYGLVRVDPSRDVKKKPIGDEENVARTDEEARKRGDHLWHGYLIAKAREHIENVDRAHASGTVPMRAKGVYAQALKVLGMEDPADKVGVAVNRRQDSDEMAALAAKVERLEALLKNKGN